MKKPIFKRLDVLLIVILIISIAFVFYKYKGIFFGKFNNDNTVNSKNQSEISSKATVWDGKEIIFFMRQQYVNFIPENEANFEKKFGKSKDILALNGETYLKNAFKNAGFKINLQIVHQDQVADTKDILRSKKVHFAYINAIGYAMLKEQFNLKPILELSKNRDSEKCSQEIHFLTGKDSDQINSLKDLNDKTFTYNYEPGGKSIPGRNLFNHWLLPRRLVLESAPNADTQFNTNYDNLFPKVLNNKNSGAISVMALYHKENSKPSYGELEAYEKSVGKQLLSQYKVIHESHYNIPCDLLVAVGDIPQDVIEVFKATVKNITIDPKGQRAFFINSSFQKVFDIDETKINNFLNLVKESRTLVLEHVPQEKVAVPTEKRPQPKLTTGKRFRISNQKK